MLVAGGVYAERCVTPETIQLLGSGGRAALVLAGMDRDVILHTFHPPALWDDLRANFAPFGISCEAHPSRHRISFSYLFPLDSPIQSPTHVARESEHLIEGQEILCFGCVEGGFIARGEAVVYDPQGRLKSGFRANGSSAGRLAFVLNAEELLALTGKESITTAARSILIDESARVVVVKDGPRGATVFDFLGGECWIPPYRSSSLYKIGSGDVFSGIFSHWWLMGLNAIDAVDRASQQTALYVNSPILPFETCQKEPGPRRCVSAARNVLLVAAAATLGELWFVAIIENSLRRLGMERVEKLDFRAWLDGEKASLDEADSSVLVYVTNAAEAEAARLKSPTKWLRQVILVDGFGATSVEQFGQNEYQTDLSQALYELFWDP